MATRLLLGVQGGRVRWGAPLAACGMRAYLTALNALEQRLALLYAGLPVGGLAGLLAGRLGGRPAGGLGGLLAGGVGVLPAVPLVV